MVIPNCFFSSLGYLFWDTYPKLCILRFGIPFWDMYPKTIS